ncbi:MAG TPA: hypothetical protein VK427_06240 [Kofleriaceae bacterium]|nr:hypothetical protein [Kofleriaceae bacterium]
MEHTLLVQSRLSIITRHADWELSQIHEAIEHKVLVDGRADLEAALGRLLVCDGSRTPKTLDLIGHATANGALLSLGDFVIDTSNPVVTAFFRELADLDVLPRLGIHAVRLLGCKTADTAQGKTTICTLSDILGLEVYGTTGLVFSAHYGPTGFSDDWRFLLIGASDLRPMLRDPVQAARSAPYDRALDVDALAAVPLGAGAAGCPRRVADDRIARNILRLVRRREGAVMPGLLAMPSCEIAIPSTKAGLYHVAQVVLDGAYVRVYPEGVSKSGVLYPVNHPQTLRDIVDELPAAR